MKFALTSVMRTILVVAVWLLLIPHLWAQDSTTLEMRLSTAKELLVRLPNGTSDAERDTISESLKRELERILHREDAFTLDLGALPISRVDAPDGTFRLLTWNVLRSDGSHRYEGWLLARNGKKVMLHALNDGTAKLPAPESPELGGDRWYGALYYQVIPVKKGAKTYYTLLGWKGYNRVETRKVIEVLHFKGDQVRFGAPLFGSGRVKANRKVFGFSFQASMMLRHDPANARIVLDHLSPARADMEGQWAFYGPDLSYDAFVWDKDHWRFERDVDARNMQRDGRPFNAPPPGP